jgi:hypothetical protein
METNSLAAAAVYFTITILKKYHYEKRRRKFKKDNCYNIGICVGGDVKIGAGRHYPTTLHHPRDCLSDGEG